MYNLNHSTGNNSFCCKSRMCTYSSLVNGYRCCCYFVADRSARCKPLRSKKYIHTWTFRTFRWDTWYILTFHQGNCNKDALFSDNDKKLMKPILTLKNRNYHLQCTAFIFEGVRLKKWRTDEISPALSRNHWELPPIWKSTWLNFTNTFYESCQKIKM